MQFGVNFGLCKMGGFSTPERITVDKIPDDNICKNCRQRHEDILAVSGIVKPEEEPPMT